MVKNKIRLAIVIPIFNNLEYTKICLQRLSDGMKNAKLDYNSIRIIIVDDGSKDGSSAWINENFPEVITLQGNGSLWWSGGVNMGVRHAIEKENCNYILWWNNDIESADDYFIELFKLLPTLGHKFIVGSKLYIKHSGKVWSMGGKLNPKNGARYQLGMEQEDSEEYNVSTDADWFPGMGTCMPSELYNEIGYLDNLNFPQYHGDSDFTWRAKLAGYRLTTYPQLKIWNDIANSGLRHNNSFKYLIQTLTSIKSNYNIKKDFLFYKKYGKGLTGYKFVFIRYIKYIGGFFKWKMLSFIGIKKSQN